MEHEPRRGLERKIIIVGAGMCGPLMALYLARRGYRVEIFERRADPREKGFKEGRLIKMTLAEKGLHALRQVGVADEVLKHTIPLRGRAIHHLDGSLSYQFYGNNRREVIHSITRTDLNVVLLNRVDRDPNISVRFGMRCLQMDRERPSVLFRDERNGEKRVVEGDAILGTDGAYSVVRRFMHRGGRADYDQQFLAWGYKALTIAAASDGSHQMDRNALHLWPRGDYILFALPSLDGTFNAVCTLPYEGAVSFERLGTDDDVRRLFKTYFPDTIELIPSLVESFRSREVSKFLTIRTSCWHHKGKVALMGDACHTVVPFYGQGMNAALDDCTVLDQCMARYPDDRARAFAEYQALRKPHTDTLAELSKRNFVELRDTARSARLSARKQTTLWLNRRFPRLYVPLYTMVTHSTLPYADCVRRAEQQDRALRRMGYDVVVGAVAAFIGLRRMLARLRLAAWFQRDVPQPRSKPDPNRRDLDAEARSGERDEPFEGEGSVEAEAWRRKRA